MDEPTRMQLHDLAALRRCCDDGVAYLDRLLASPQTLSTADLTRLRFHRARLEKASVAAGDITHRIRDDAGGL